MVWSRFQFLSTLSLRRATTSVSFSEEATKHFYPRSPCGERRVGGGDMMYKYWISIHALLAESDEKVLVIDLDKQNFYPRSPCGERPTDRLRLYFHHVFLSTLSLRRATRLQTTMQSYQRNFYPRSPCGERHGRTVEVKEWGNFYPRSPCGERLSKAQRRGREPKFLSTLSLRRATFFPVR